MNKLKIAMKITVALGIGFLSFNTASVYAHPNPILIGMDYGSVRQQIIQEGWQPYVPVGALALSCSGKKGPCTYNGIDQSNEARDSFIKREIALRKFFRDLGWFEAIHCFPTGPGWCYHSFNNINGMELVVQTESGSLKQMPKVHGIYFHY